MDEWFFRSAGDFPVALNEARVGAIEIKAWTERYAAVRLRSTAGDRISLSESGSAFDDQADLIL
jgi:hypothetical protein